MVPPAASGWPGLPEVPCLADHDVHVVAVALREGPAGVAARPEEQARAERLRDEVVAARFLASRAWLRVILGRYLRAAPQAVGLTRTVRGKPSIVGGGDLAFSLARSGEVALIALTRGRAIGVDVERVRSEVAPGLVIERFFSPAEVRHLGGLGDAERHEAFFRLWVRKEAVVKASGAGLGDGLDHFDGRGDRVAGRWSLAALDVGPGYVGAVAVEGRLGACSSWVLPADGLPLPPPRPVTG